MRPGMLRTYRPIVLPIALNNFANGALLQNHGSSMAGALLASAPTLVVYIVLGRYFIGGLMSGSVKG
jgi:glucose/mannose transport system permease protein